MTNPGTVPLVITSVTDDAGTRNDLTDDFDPQYVSGDGNSNGQLDPGENWLYTSAGVITFIVTSNLYGNFGTVVATTTDGQPLTPASDPSYHLGNDPTLFVQKAINAQDPLNPTPEELAQAAPGRPLPVGTTVVWTYKAYNGGDGPIQVTSLRDDAGTPSDPSDDFSPTPVLQVGTNFNVGDTDLDGLLDINEAWLFTSQGTGSGAASTPDWNRVYQDVLNATDTSGTGLTPGFVTDPVGTPNAFADNIFTNGESKDSRSVSQWQWKYQQPQDKDDIAHAFGASYADADTGHRLLFTGLDRYASNGNTTVGFWFFQEPVAAVAGGTFSGAHTDGDLLLVVDFTVGGSNPVVGLYRWTGTDANGTLTPQNAPAGSIFVEVNSGPVSVPWSFIDKDGFTSPQAGEFLRVGVDLTALFGANVPDFVAFLAETRSSQSTTATLSDFAFGSLISVHTHYTVAPGAYSNTVTAFGNDPLTGTTLTSTNTNYHHGVVSGPQKAAYAPSAGVPGVSALTEAELAPVVDEARARWLAVDANPAILASVRFGILDLPDGINGELPLFGYTTGNTVQIDLNAGGFGWFIDPTPGDDVEFDEPVSTSELRASGNSPAFGRIDLLTVVLHELGHVLGLGDLGNEEHAHDLLAETLAPGTRRLPGSAQPSVAPRMLSETQPVLEAPIARLQTAGLSNKAAESLSTLTIETADLNGTGLVEALAGLIRRDDVIAGIDWFLDPTPVVDDEFKVETGRALEEAALGRVDLSAALFHELFHLLGGEDRDSDELPHYVLTEALPPDRRHLPIADELDQLFANQELLGSLLSV